MTQTIDTGVMRVPLCLAACSFSMFRLFWGVTAFLIGFPAIGSPEELRGSALIVGNGPERYAVKSLAKDFEALHPNATLDFFWHQNARPVEEVRKRAADVAVTGQAENDLPSTTVAWDGIAVVTNFANPVEALTREDLAKIFSGTFQYWSQVDEDGPEARISLIHRTWNQNIRQPLERLLGITRHKAIKGTTVEKEEATFKAVNGDIYSISYVSMGPALQARRDGYGVTLVFVDDVEPEDQTVLDGTYPLRRPVVFVMSPHASRVAQAFLAYVVSPAGQRAIQTGASGLFQDKTSSVIKYYPLTGE